MFLIVKRICQEYCFQYHKRWVILTSRLGKLIANNSLDFGCVSWWNHDSRSPRQDSIVCKLHIFGTNKMLDVHTYDLPIVYCNSSWKLLLMQYNRPLMMDSSSYLLLVCDSEKKICKMTVCVSNRWHWWNRRAHVTTIFENQAIKSILLTSLSSLQLESAYEFYHWVNNDANWFLRLKCGIRGMQDQYRKQALSSISCNINACTLGTENLLIAKRKTLLNL